MSQGFFFFFPFLLVSFSSNPTIINPSLRLLLSLALVNSILGCLVGLLVNCVVQHTWAMSSVRLHYQWRIRWAYILSISIAIYILIIAVLKQVVGIGQEGLVAVSIVGVVATFCICLLPVKTGPLVKRNVPRLAEMGGSAAASSNADSSSSSSPSSIPLPPIIDASDIVSNEAPRKGEDDFEVAAENAIIAGPKQLKGDDTRDVLRSLDFYILFFIWFIGAGTVNATINNIASVVTANSYDASLVYPPVPQKDVINSSMAYTFVALFSSFNTLGRLGFGFLSDWFAGRFPRSFWLLVCSVSILLSMASMLISNLYGIFPLIMVMGFCYGGLFGLLPSLIADRFGEKNFGLNYGLSAIAPALGSICLSTLAAGGLADFFAQAHSIVIVATNGALSSQCIGDDCYFFTFLLFTMLLLLSTVASGIIWWRSSRLNNENNYKVANSTVVAYN